MTTKAAAIIMDLTREHETVTAQPISSRGRQNGETSL
jgi:hypothetical protein